MPPIRRPRGPYKTYINNPDVPVPRTTAWRNRQPVREEEDEGDSSSDDESNASQISERGLSSDNSGDDNASDGNNADDGASSRSDNSDGSEDGSTDGNRSDSSVGDFDNDVNGGNAFEEESEEEDEYDFFRGGENDMDVEDEQDEANHVNIRAADRDVEEEVPLEEERGAPLYEGCPLSTAESDFLIMSYVIRWGLVDKSIAHLLQLIDCHLPCSVMGSQYLFLKKFRVPDLSKVRLTCSECLGLLRADFEDGPCQHCEANLHKKQLKEGGHFFMELSITEQIKSIVQNESIFPLLRKQCQEKDVISGEVYTNLRANGVIGDNDLTLQVNTDGASPFRTAKITVWPIQACINELPYHARRENMILCGFYFGRHKPNFTSFLRPFVDELEQLHSVGVQCRFPGQMLMTTVKVHTILASVDSVARPPLQGLNQFNGRYGCSFCLKRGMRIDRGGGRARIYAGGTGQRRTMAHHLQSLQTLTEYNDRHRKKKKHWFGIQKASVLLRLSVFNVTASFVPDYLHCILEGVVKQFLEHWSNNEYKNSDWYLNKAKRMLISERVKSTMPPVEMTRVPKHGLFEDVKHMRASQFRHFLLYYSLPSLKGVLPAKYLKHWFLLVYGMWIYLKDDYTREEYALAQLALTSFVDEIYSVYPNCFHLYTFNVHLILHIPRAVKKFGGLWGSSTFPYEHFNGVLARLIHGTRHIPEQVCRSYARLRVISRDGERVFSLPNASDSGKKLFNSLLCKYRTSQFSEQVDNQLRLFGSPQEHLLSLVEKVSAERLLGEEIVRTVRSFRRMIFSGIVYHAAVYEALRVRNNSIVKLRDGKIISILRIVLVELQRSRDIKCVLIGMEFDVLNEELCNVAYLGLSTRPFIHVCRESNRTVCALAKDVVRKCVLVPYENECCVIPLVNLLERD